MAAREGSEGGREGGREGVVIVEKKGLRRTYFIFFFVPFSFPFL